MELELSVSEASAPVSVEKIGSFIISLQKENGEIPGQPAERPIRGIM